MNSPNASPEQSPASAALGRSLLDLAAAAWRMLHERAPVAEEIAKDPFTSSVKEQAATAEFLILALHVCDRLAAAIFNAALSTQAAAKMRHAFMATLVDKVILAFVRTVCEDDEEEQEETEADLFHLYNMRATQYGFFPLGQGGAVEGSESFFMVAGIRLAEALECAERADVIAHGVAVVIAGLTPLREQPVLKTAIKECLAEKH